MSSFALKNPSVWWISAEMIWSTVWRKFSFAGNCCVVVVLSCPSSSREWLSFSLALEIMVDVSSTKTQTNGRMRQKRSLIVSRQSSSNGRKMCWLETARPSWRLICWKRLQIMPRVSMFSAIHHIDEFDIWSQTWNFIISNGIITAAASLLPRDATCTDRKTWSMLKLAVCVSVRITSARWIFRLHRNQQNVSFSRRKNPARWNSVWVAHKWQTNQGKKIKSDQSIFENQSCWKDRSLAAMRKKMVMCCWY